LLTHAFNAMPGLGHRAVGPVGAALERDHVVLEVVADGVHLHPVVIRTVFAAAPGRVALVTDAMSATGLGDGNYRLGGLEVEVNDGRPTLTGTDTLAGSTLTMERAIAVATAAGVSPDDARSAATAVPAGVLDIR
jgi:N-acetylglucosamine-6-phosphate deacetylase